MTSQEAKEFRDLIVEAIKISAEKFRLTKKKLGQKIVVSRNGVITIVDPKDIK